MNELQSTLVMSWWWTYSMFPVYAVEAQAPGFQRYALILLVTIVEAK